MQLSLGDDLGAVTLGPAVKLKQNVFQGLVVQVREIATLPAVLAKVRALPRLRKSEHLPHASRIRCPSTLHPSVLLETMKPQDHGAVKKKQFRPTEDPMVAEDWEDDGEFGVGDRLLHVLQRWQVENVLLLVARQDDSLSGRLIGQELFKLMMEAAKLALEQFYMANIKPSDAAKLQIYQEAKGEAQYIVSPREESQPRQQRASVCVMDTATVESWPQKHQPTSDGGGRKVAKKGRVNHFLHDKKAVEPAAATPSNNDETVAVATEPESSDSLVACDGIEWLGISRDEWIKLRAIRVPVKELHYLFMCLVVLMDKPLEQQSKSAPTSRQKEEFQPPSYSWNRCREVLQHTAHWGDKLRHFHGSNLTKSQVIALRSVLQEPNVNEAALVRVSSASVKIFGWIQRLMDEYDEKELGLAPSISPPPPTVQLTPQPPRQQRQLQSFSGTAEESALMRELNALAHHSDRQRIIDRGRLLSHPPHHR